ncbi:MAG TPA: efflux RND transporter periplasmic adaptor subunit, partial [Candidatus Methylomirabilis sp.]|nr:efflux RND transporter periplasmic adaptor subunit [Candidatus Methylomirabilis sp.]
QAFQGRVVQIRQAAQVIQNVVTYDCVVAVGNPDLKLMPGMTANVKILVARRDNTLLVPNAAFRVRLDGPAAGDQTGPRTGGPLGPQTPGGGRPAGQPGMGPGRGSEVGARSAGGGQQRVWVLQDGKPVERMVRTGLSDGQKIEIVEGLQEGDLVITGLASGPRGAGPSGGPRFRL